MLAPASPVLRAARIKALQGATSDSIHAAMPSESTPASDHEALVLLPMRFILHSNCVAVFVRSSDVDAASMNLVRDAATLLAHGRGNTDGVSVAPAERRVIPMAISSTSTFLWGPQRCAPTLIHAARLRAAFESAPRRPPMNGLSMRGPPRGARAQVRLGGGRVLKFDSEGGRVHGGSDPQA